MFTLAYTSCTLLTLSFILLNLGRAIFCAANARVQRIQVTYETYQRRLIRSTQRLNMCDGISHIERYK